MKTILLAIVVVGLSFSAVQALPPTFIVVMIETSWSDGVVASPGQVEEVKYEIGNEYRFVSPKGQTYGISKTSARKVSTDEAVGLLIAQRAKLLQQIEAGAQPVAPVPPVQTVVAEKKPTQYNGRPLPANWIDPAQADQNFYNQQILQQQQLLQQQRQIQADLQQRRR